MDGGPAAQISPPLAPETSYAKQFGQRTVVWDNGYTGVGDDQFGLMNRNTVQWQRPNIVNALQAAAG